MAISHHADVIVVGLGAMGSATTYQCAKRGMRTIGIDQFRPPHTLGSTHGESRVTRQACAEGAAYVPLAMRSHELWREIEAETGTELFEACGVLMVAPDAMASGLHGTQDWLAETLSLARQFEIEHETLDGRGVRDRYPMLNVPDEYGAYFEPGGGFVRPEAAVEAQLELAGRCGAELRFGERVTVVHRCGDGVEVVTASGRYTADQVVLSVGAWSPDFIGDQDLRANFVVQRQVLHWFEVDPRFADHLTPDQCPVYMWSFGTGASDFFYGFPMLEGAAGGVKLATEQNEHTTNPAAVDRAVDDVEARDMHERCVRGRMLAAAPRPLRSATCLYTVTPDSGFVIDAHPEHANVMLASPCSGHGFKHSAAIGEALAQRLTSGSSQIDLSPFGLDRLHR